MLQFMVVEERCIGSESKAEGGGGGTKALQMLNKNIFE